MIAVVFDHDDFNFSITIPFMKKKDFTVIQEAFFRVAQSYKYSLLSRHRNLRAYVQIQKIPVGAGRRALQPHEKKKYIPKKVEKEKKIEKVKTRIKNLKKKQKRYVRVADRTEKEPTYLQKQLNFKAKVIKIYNKDNKCALRAILYAKALIDIKKKLIKKLPTANQFNSQVKIISKKLNLQNKPCGINEIRQIEFYLNNFSINIIDGRAGACEEFIYKGITTSVNNKNYIYIVLTDSHYNVIPSML
jgi:hypothetical protein